MSESTSRSWTIDEYLHIAQRRGVLHPDDRALAEAVARADYFMEFLLEDLPLVIVQGSSAERALSIGIVTMQPYREGRLPKPFDPREKGAQSSRKSHELTSPATNVCWSMNGIKLGRTQAV